MLLLGLGAVALLPVKSAWGKVLSEQGLAIASNAHSSQSCTAFSKPEAGLQCSPTDLQPPPFSSVMQEHQAVPELSLPAPANSPQLIAAPENFNPDWTVQPPAPEPRAILSEPIANPAPPAIERQASNEEVDPQLELADSPLDLQEETAQTPAPFFTLDTVDLDLKDVFSTSGQGNLRFEPVFKGHLYDGTPVQFSSGFNVYDEPEFARLINIPFRLGYQEVLEGVPVEIVGGVDFFDRLSPHPNFSTQADIPLGQRATLSFNLDYGLHKFNVETLENRISAFRYGPSLFWQIDDQTTLFSNVTWGRYSDSNREQQSFSRLERRLGDEVSVAMNLFNWRYRQDIGSDSGYFSPLDFLVYNGEVAWEKPLGEDLKCRLSGSLGQQHADGAWSSAYGYDALCSWQIHHAVELDLGYSFSNVIDQETGGSSSQTREIKSNVQLQF